MRKKMEKLRGCDMVWYVKWVKNVISHHICRVPVRYHVISHVNYNLLAGLVLGR